MPSVAEMECPQVFQIDGRWYLIFSTSPGFAGPEILTQMQQDQHYNHIYSMVADDIWGPYTFDKTITLQPSGTEPSIYAGQLVQWQGEWYMLGFARDENGPLEYIADPIKVAVTANGLLAAG